MSALVLLDNTVLSNLARVNRPDLAFLLWGDATCTTPAAYGELLAGIAASGLPPGAWAGIPIVTPTPVEAATGATLPENLGDGERSCLAVAIHRGGAVATDDRRARRVAQVRGVRLFGTVGILVLNVCSGDLQLDEGNALLARMMAAGYHPPVQTLDSLLS